MELPDGNGAVGCAPPKRRGVTYGGSGDDDLRQLWWENSTAASLVWRSWPVCTFRWAMADDGGGPSGGYKDGATEGKMCLTAKRI